jgi:GntR family transcriptional repressor for pyruvate dehydrogenase complex
MGNVAQATIDEHQAILSALESRDQLLAQAAALMHVNTSESWLRKILNDQDAAPVDRPGQPNGHGHGECREGAGRRPVADG